MKSTKRTLITAPTVDLVTVAQLKDHLRIDATDEDDDIKQLCGDAYGHIETILWRSLLAQTWDVYFDGFASKLWIPLPPLSSITSIKYYDTSSVQQTVTASVYEISSRDDVGFVRLAYDQTWPSDVRGHPDDVVVRCVTGYGTAATDVPASIRHAVKMLAGDLYENREASTDLKLMELLVYRGLLLPYQVREY